ncbi:hypothetical protein Nepgr_018100 [Nepenthes gracilis]|uniref:BHLH domain-containing protein n=1 Tax=Nepenthes gracilis TaxID=150966 RepID=A0AAD3XTQ6_NEPGR|nr:hypothetical protein Nepgr_018100 [Nepenthes gracilis]
MNRTRPEMLHCLNATGNLAAATSREMSVLERQRAVLKWHQEQLKRRQQRHFDDLNVFSAPLLAQNINGLIDDDGSGLNEILTRPTGMETGRPDFGSKSGVILDLDHSAGHVNASSGYCLNFAISGNINFPPTVVAAATQVNTAVGAEAKVREPTTSERLSVTTGRQSSKKRKAEKSLPSEVDEEEDSIVKKIRGCADEEEPTNSDQHQNSNKNNWNNNSSKNKESNGDKSNREASSCTSKGNSKASAVQKPDYVHVRARRGQATDSHSLAERIRREKISERMKYLQELVPGCNKITGKSGMLDEIINYVQSLQRQVEYLSMKLAALNPSVDVNINDLFAKEVSPACLASYLPTMGVSPEMASQSYLEYNPVETMGQVCVSEGVNLVDASLRRSMSPPVSIPETLLHSSCFNQIHNSLPWELDLQSLFSMEFQQERPINCSLADLCWPY